MTDRIGGFDKKLGHTRTNTDDTKPEKPTPRANALSEQTRHTRTQNSDRNTNPPTLGLSIFGNEKPKEPATPRGLDSSKSHSVGPLDIPPTVVKEKEKEQATQQGWDSPKSHSVGPLVIPPTVAKEKEKGQATPQGWDSSKSHSVGPLDIPRTADFDVKTGVAGEVHVVELETIETVQIVQTQPLRKGPAISPLPLTTLNTEKQSRSQGDELPQVA